MVKDTAFYELFASYKVPNHEQVGYWVDLKSNPRGEVIRVYNNNTRSWTKITEALPDIVNGSAFKSKREDGTYRETGLYDDPGDVSNILLELFEAVNSNNAVIKISQSLYDKIKNLAKEHGISSANSELFIYDALTTTNLLNGVGGDCAIKIIYSKGEIHVYYNVYTAPYRTVEVVTLFDIDVNLHVKVQSIQNGVITEGVVSLLSSGDGTKYLNDAGEYETVNEVYVGSTEPTGNEEIWINPDEDYNISSIGLVEEAPLDNKLHARKNGQWVEFIEENTDLSVFATKTDLETKVDEAPTDDKQYARKNGEWSEVTSEGVYVGDTEPTGNQNVWIDPSDDSIDINAIPEAPVDNKPYVRKDGEWVNMHNQYENEDIAILIMDMLNRESYTITQEEYNKFVDICPVEEIAFASSHILDKFTSEGGSNKGSFKIVNDGEFIIIYTNMDYAYYFGYQSFTIIINSDLSYELRQAYGYIMPGTNTDTGESLLNLASVSSSTNESHSAMSTLISGGDGTKFLSNSGEYKTVSPLINEEYGKIVADAITNETITQDNFDKLKNAVTDTSVANTGSLFCEGYVEGIGTSQISIIKIEQGFAVYVHVQMAGTSNVVSNMVNVVNINNDLTVEVIGGEVLNLTSSGDGTKFLADNGEYLAIDKNADTLDGYNSDDFVKTVRLNARNDHRIYVIELFTFENTNEKDKPYSYGTITGHRTNGLLNHGPSTILYNSMQRYMYNENYYLAACGMLHLGTMSYDNFYHSKFNFCTYIRNDIKRLGIYFNPGNSVGYSFDIHGHWTSDPQIFEIYDLANNTPKNIEIWNSVSIGGKDISLQSAYVNDEEILTINALNEDLLTYGVKWESNGTNPVLTRIGNSSMHQTLPIQSKMRGCTLADDGTVNHYFNNDWTANTDGTPIVKDGSDGMVMIEIPEHYVKYEVVDGYNTIRLSEIALAGYTKVDKQYISAYEATVDRTDSTKLKLASVVNNSVEFRGGINKAEWDSGENTLLGKPLTYTTRDNFRKYARNRGNENEYYWNMYDFIAYNTLCTFYIVEYANLNSQLAVNTTLTSNGYKQGGLGTGVTNLTGVTWNAFNNYNPIIPCGYSDSLGNNSGEVAYTMPASYGTLTTYVNRYRGVENLFGHIWKNIDGVTFDIKTDDDGGTSTIYIATNPEKYKDSVDEGYIAIGELPRANGYGKSLYLGTFFPSAVGGSTTTGLCDYFHTNISSSSLSVCLMGGNAYVGDGAGITYVESNGGVNAAAASYGSRLIFRKQ